MKDLRSKLTFGLVALLALPTYAGPNASGGTPETHFQHDRAAIQTILNSEKVLGLLAYKGAISSVVQDLTNRDVYIINTQKCALAVKFIRECDFSGSLPNCVYSAEILGPRSKGDCSRP